MFFNENEETEEMILIHWGAKEKRVKLSYQSWFFNSDGNRSASNDFNRLLASNDLISIPVEFDGTEKQNLNLDINSLLKAMGQDLTRSKVNKMTVSHGVWARVLMRESNIKSLLNIDSVNLIHNTNEDFGSNIVLNQENIESKDYDISIPYFDFNSLNKKKANP